MIRIASLARRPLLGWREGRALSRVTASRAVVLVVLLGAALTGHVGVPPAAASHAAAQPEPPRLAFHDDTVVYEVTAGQERARAVTSTPAGGGKWRPTWSPDGTHLAYVAPICVAPAGCTAGWLAGTAIYVVNVRTGDARAVLSLPHVIISTLEWSPDGGRLAFTATKVWETFVLFLPSDSDVYVVDIDGTDLTPVTADGLSQGPTWSPDGTRLAYVSARGGTGAIYVAPPTLLGAATLVSTGGLGYAYSPVWLPDGRAIAYLASAGPLQDDVLDPYGDNPSEIWIAQADGSEQHAIGHHAFALDWSPDPDRLAFATLSASGDREEVYVLRLGGQPELVALGDFPQWAPDGRHLAVRLNLDHSPYQSLGVVDLYDGFVTTVVHRGLLSADFRWTGPAGLVHAGRLDGGGESDPVAQAIATSQRLFAGGAASRVVLATSDRFPDALAGAALAGSEGPVLFTPSARALDPRVEAEIARVTAGDGVVLTLGGTAAVTEQAAAQALAAGGNRPCEPPLPTSCRYPGSGREHTAALVAETVLAEHPGGRVLLARGDEFADAIAGGAYAAAAGVPILLTPPDTLATAAREFITAHTIGEVVVLGGPNAVAEATYATIPAADRRRVAGPDRTATAAAIATQLWQAEGRAGRGVVLVNVRHDHGWQAALSAAVASARYDAPQLGVDTPPATPGQAVTDAAAFLGGPVQAFGSPTLVSDDQLAAVAAAARPAH